MTKIEMSLPDQLADQARRAGLLDPARPEGWLRELLCVQGRDKLFSAMDRMAAAQNPAAMTPEEISEELATMRAERCG